MSDQLNTDELNTEESRQHFLDQFDATKQGIYELSEEELENVAGGGWMGDVARFLHLDVPVNYVADLLHVPRPIRAGSGSTNHNH
jgi:hypothetical protein